MDKVNVLIFPAGSESALDIYDSLRYNVHFTVFGASGKADHAEFVYPKEMLFLGDLYISNPDFVVAFNKLIAKFKIDYVIPTHDTIASFLTRNQNNINAKVVCSPSETARIAENKKLTYEALSNQPFCPIIYQSPEEISRYPVFLKPCVGAGGKGTQLVQNKEELETVLASNPELLLCEYLPGNEYTVDCFTDKDGMLLFAGPRKRGRVTSGITCHSERVELGSEVSHIASELSVAFKLRGAWFFQIKEDESGRLKLMEFSVRQAGTMAFYRQLGVNFAALSLFDAMGCEVKVLFNDYKLTLDRRLSSSYHFDYEYDKLYVDFDDTLIVGGKVNTTLIKLIYQCVNAGKKVILLTKHADDLDESLRRHRINSGLFSEIILLEPAKRKSDYIDKHRAVFIDNLFAERSLVRGICNIPVFDVDAVECLLDASAI